MDRQARLMYLGDLQEKDEDDMKKLWQQWKSQAAAGLPYLEDF